MDRYNSYTVFLPSLTSAFLGLVSAAVDQFGALRAVMAGSFGSILTLGIGPIVSASIILQLLVGGKILNLDLSRHEDKALFQGTQKLLAIIFTLFEAAVLVLAGAVPTIRSFIYCTSCSTDNPWRNRHNLYG